MPKRNKYHLTFNSKQDNWGLKKEGSQRPTKAFKTKGEGLKLSREFVREREPSQLIVHKKDGTIQTEHTYKNDPKKYKG
ncbi:MAG: DUF2188 domain-containing protein [Candidatus Dadabacteria bacterium]|nr:DUF2188 domain-containing protein [Candidatus Dadabacteria bacterium]